MTCDWVQQTIDRYDPSTELSDAVVEHIDACPACRAALDARFTPALALDTPEREEDTLAKAEPISGSAWWGPPAVMAVAAAVVLLLPLTASPPPPGDSRLAMSRTEVCEVVWEPPECELR